jgi:hypothetical protein
MDQYPYHPYWTIETARPQGFLWRRSPRLLMSPQHRLEDVGQWLIEYRDDHPADPTFARLRVLEHPLEGITPIPVDRPAGFVDYARDPLAGDTYLPDLHVCGSEEPYGSATVEH